MTMVAPRHDDAQLPEARAQRLAPWEIRRPGNQHDLINLRAGLEELKGTFQNRSSIDLHEHIVEGSTHPRSLPSGHDDGGRAHRLGSARPRTRAASQSPIMSVISASLAVTRARASARG